MVAVAVVAAVCALFSLLTGTELQLGAMVSILVAMVGVYVAAALACGAVLNLIAPVDPRERRPPVDPLADHQVDARAEVSTSGIADFLTEREAP